MKKWPARATPSFVAATRYLYDGNPSVKIGLLDAMVAHWAWISDWGTMYLYRTTHNYGGVPFTSSTPIGKSGPPDAYGRLVQYEDHRQFVEGYLLYFGDMLNHDAEGFFDTMQVIDPGSPKRWDKIRSLWGDYFASADGHIRT